MKIRHPFVLRLLAFVLFWLVRLWMSTVHIRYQPYGTNMDPRVRRRNPVLLLFWHEYLLAPFHYCVGSRVRALVSQHADGELAARIIQHGRMGTIRGSATRGGVAATRQLLDAAQQYDLVIIPDGPRGPRRKIKPAVIHLAAKSGMPILVAGIGYQRPWRLRTWDRFAIPRPFSRIAAVTFEPIHIPPVVRRAEVETWCRTLEEAMERAARIAEHWAETGKWLRVGVPLSGERAEAA